MSTAATPALKSAPNRAGLRIVVFLATLAVALGCVIVMSRRSTANLESLQRKFDEQTIENRRLAQIRYNYNRVEKLKETYRWRVELIEKLKQFGGVDLTPQWAMLDQSLRKNAGVTVVSLKVALERMELHGVTKSPEALGSFKGDLAQALKYQCGLLQAPGADTGRGASFDLECVAPTSTGNPGGKR